MSEELAKDVGKLEAETEQTQEQAEALELDLALLSAQVAGMVTTIEDLLRAVNNLGDRVTDIEINGMKEEEPAVEDVLDVQAVEASPAEVSETIIQPGAPTEPVKLIKGKRTIIGII